MGGGGVFNRCITRVQQGIYIETAQLFEQIVFVGYGEHGGSQKLLLRRS